MADSMTDSTASFMSDSVLQSLVDLTSGATLLKAGRSVGNSKKWTFLPMC